MQRPLEWTVVTPLGYPVRILLCVIRVWKHWLGLVYLSSSFPRLPTLTLCVTQGSYSRLSIFETGVT